MSEDYVFGSEESDGFLSFYGDANGDRNVGIIDLLTLRQSYGSFDGDSQYEFYMDYDGGGAINIFDLLQFRHRYGESLPFTFAAAKASPTIGGMEKSTSSKKSTSGR